MHLGAYSLNNEIRVRFRVRARFKVRDRVRVRVRNLECGLCGIWIHRR